MIYPKTQRLASYWGTEAPAYGSTNCGLGESIGSCSVTCGAGSRGESNGKKPLEAPKSAFAIAGDANVTKAPATISPPRLSDSRPVSKESPKRATQIVAIAIVIGPFAALDSQFEADRTAVL